MTVMSKIDFRHNEPVGLTTPGAIANIGQYKAVSHNYPFQIQDLYSKILLGLLVGNLKIICHTKKSSKAALGIGE